MSDFTVSERAARPTAVVRGKIPMSELPAFFGRAFMAVDAALRARGRRATGEPFAYYPSMPGETIEVEAGFPVDQPVLPAGEVVPSGLPGGTVVSGTHIGPYDTLVNTYAALSKWAAGQGLRLSGPMWEVYLSDPQREPDPSTWRTDVFACAVPIAVPASTRPFL
jgi:effector-binding domain-containing protein